MEQVIRTSTQRLHPVIIAAAVSVIALSATGIAAFTGVLPIHKTEVPALVGSNTDAPVTTPAGSLPTNTVVIQNSVPQAAPAIAPTSPIEVAPPKPAPKVIRTRTVHTAPAPVVADAGSTVYHPTAVSATGSEVPLPPPPAVSQMQAPPVCSYCGTVEGVREVKQAGEAHGIGAVAGGLGGAVIGKQFGNGRGSTALAVLGAVGGALAGHQVEKQVRSTTAYEVTVRMEDGSTRSVQQSTPPAWRTGERVRVDGNTISVM